MGFLVGLWNKAYAYVILGFTLLAGVAAIYLRGRGDANREAERRALGKDLENRKLGESIRGTVALEPDPVERLRRWRRPGS